MSLFKIDSSARTGGKRTSRRLGPLTISLLIHIGLGVLLLVVGFSVAEAPRVNGPKAAITLELPASLTIPKTAIPASGVTQVMDPAREAPNPAVPKPDPPRSSPRAFRAPRLAATRRPQLQQQEAPEQLRIDIASRSVRPVVAERDIRLAPAPPPPKTVKLGNLAKPEFAETTGGHQRSLTDSGFGTQATEVAISGERKSGELAQAGFGSQQVAAKGTDPVRRGVGQRTGAFAKPEAALTPEARSRQLEQSGFRAVHVESPRHSQETVAAVAATPVRILSTPQPAYTDEARALGLEGEVLLKVQFRASGDLQILEVIQGLGHGLDEAAVEAARQIQFEPAQREGIPMDSSAIVHIVFQLA